MKTECASFLSRLSIRTRLLLLAVCSVGVALSVTCFALSIYNYYCLRHSTVEQLRSQAQMLAFNSGGVLSFQDAESAEQLLASLRMFPSVESAYLVDRDGQVLSTFPPSRQADYSQYAGQADHQFTADGHLLIRQAVTENDEQIGRLVLVANLEGFYVQLRDYVLIVAGVMLLSLAIAAFLSLRLQRAISIPIAKLVEAAKTVAEKKDYSTRVMWSSENELGQLCATFDRMLNEIQESKEELQTAHDGLEVRVKERTAQLTAEIQERKRVLVQLESAKDAAEAANKAKSEFLANMSHEIRTPLNGVLGFTDLLASQIDDGDTEVCKEYLETIQTSGKHLLVLINDILDISKIEAGQLEVEQISCCPHEVITQVTSVLRAQAQAKGLDLQYRWASQVPEIIRTDPARLRQLLTNLVGNALKFTHEGFVCITARIDVPREELIVSVEDTGVGISTDKQQGIFEPFVQADTSVTRRFGGTGLGLAISRRLATAMGGDLEVSSEEGQGSCFTARVATGNLDDVQLRRGAAADAVMPTRDEPVRQTPKDRENTSTGLSGKRILVVDDGPINRKLLQAILEEAGAKVTLAENGQVGYEVGRQGEVDAILMDMQMPVMDGYTSARKLREAGITIPIIGLTAHAMTGDREKCLNAGCCGYMTKPVDAQELLGYLASRLDSPTADVPQSEAAEPRVDQTEICSGDDRLRSTLPIDKPIYAEIVAEFAEYAVGLLTEIEDHLSNEDYQQVAILAHSLKGSGGSAGFPDFTDPAKGLELDAKNSNSANCNKHLAKLHQLAARIEVPATPEHQVTI